MLSEAELEPGGLTTLAQLQSGQRVGLSHHVECDEARSQLLFGNIRLAEVYRLVYKLTSASHIAQISFHSARFWHVYVSLIEDVDLGVLVPIATLLSHRRVLSKAGHQVRGAKCVNVADGPFSEVIVAFMRVGKGVPIALVGFVNAGFDWITDLL